MPGTQHDDTSTATEQVVRGEHGDYSFEADLVTDVVDEIVGYRQLPGEFDDGYVFTEDWTEHRVREYARLHGVGVTILSLHGPGGGWPSLRFTGTFTAITDLWCAHNDATVDRARLRAALEPA